MMLATIDIAVPTHVLMTWGVMVLLVGLALVVRRKLVGRGVGRLQSVFEIFMESLCSLIREIVRAAPEPYVPLVGTLFLFVFASNLMGMLPRPITSPTADPSIPAALAAIVFLAVPFYGIRSQGIRAYLRGYTQPNPFMLPLNVLSEITRTFALAMRLFGNIMSGEILLLVVVGVITSLLRGYAHVFIPAAFVLTLFLSVLSLITAVIQAYIFTVLALVYIGAAAERRTVKETKPQEAGS